MSQPKTDELQPFLPITIVLGRTIARRLSDAARVAVAQDAVVFVVTELLAVLGIPASPIVSLRGEPAAPPDGRPLEFLVDDRLCPCPDELLLLSYSYNLAQLPVPPDSLDELERWLAETSDSDLAEWLALTAKLALGRQAALLLGPAQAAAYCAALPIPSDGDTLNGCVGPWDATTLLPILHQVLALGISISDRAAAALLARMSDSAPAAILEPLIATLRPDVMELRVEPAYLRQLTGDGARLNEVFAFMFDGLFVELGLVFPPIHLVADPTLKPSAFALTINHLVGPYRIGLQPDRILVNDSADRLKLMQIAGEKACNPANSYSASVVDADRKGMLESAGLTTWDMLGYVVLCIANDLRFNSGRFIERTAVVRMLEQLGKAFPALTQAAEEQIPSETLIGILRALAAEQISVRDLRCILEQLLEYELFVDRDDPRVSRLDFVRAGLSRYIAHKLSRATRTLVTYLLDPELEQLLARPAPANEADAVLRRIVSALRAELQHLPPTAALPVILTTAAARAQLQPILAATIPRLAVVSYGDIPPEHNIQPVARIALP